MFSSLFRRKPAPIVPKLCQEFGTSGLEFFQQGLPSRTNWWRQSGLAWTPSDLPRILLLRQLDDDGILVTENDRLLLPYSEWPRLTPNADDNEDAQRALGVASAFPFQVRLVSKGDLRQPKFEISLEFSDREAQRFELPPRQGPFITRGGKHYFLSQPLLHLVALLEESRDVIELGDTTKRLLVIGKIRSAAVVAGAELDGYLADQHVVSPETVFPVVSISSTDSDQIDVTAGFSDLEPNPKFQSDLDAGPVKGIYQYNLDDGGSARVVLSEPIQEAVQQLKKVRKLKGKERRRFLDSPAEFLSHPAFDLTEFGDRVVGIVAQRVRFYPPPSSSETEWFPEIALTVADESGQLDPWELVVSEENVEEMLSLLKTAQDDGISSFEYKGMDFPANAVVEAELHDLAKRLRPPAEGATPAKPARLELDIKENIESLDYHKVASDQQSALEEMERPGSLKSEIQLLPHQREGVGWLQALYRRPQSSGALLADDMGLGKTLQLWTLLEWVRLRSTAVKPSLIVCPVSLIHNWEDEYNRFFGGPSGIPPSAFARLHGAETQRHLKGKNLDLERLRRYDYVLTSFETLRQYHLDLPRIDWACVVLDEAQKIKNPATQVTRAAKALKADFRIASTGTPVENGLDELWCIVDFIEPGRLGCLKDFLKEFPKDPTQAEDLTEKIQARCGPLMKRRMKTQILTGLPAKTWESPRVNFSPSQHRQYVSALATAKQPEPPAVLTVLQTLRRLCAFHEGAELCINFEDVERESAKFGWLIQALDRIRERDEKVLIFLEMRQYQRLLAHRLGERYGFTVRTINGEVSTDRHKDGSRHQILDEFHNQPGFRILILSPLAAGVGLTITCANHVIHYARHWNPAKEDQATDRAYRIGQKKDVFVYYPMCVDPEFRTFDEGLNDLLERKRALAEKALFPSLYGEISTHQVMEEIVGKVG